MLGYDGDTPRNTRQGGDAMFMVTTPRPSTHTILALFITIPRPICGRYKILIRWGNNVYHVGLSAAQQHHPEPNIARGKCLSH